MDEHVNGQTDERKDENYIPFGINAGGILLICSTVVVYVPLKNDKAHNN